LLNGWQESQRHPADVKGKPIPLKAQVSVQFQLEMASHKGKKNRSLASLGMTDWQGLERWKLEVLEKMI
jgi:hypothetical protein